MATDMGLRECDIIMKGGITSGVVYPHAILRLAEQHRFRSIGGTSAGAIAAVITAAAEYNRQGGGFEAIKGIPGEVRDKLASLFQPTPSVEPIFQVGKAASEQRWLSAVAHLVRGYWIHFLILAIALVALYLIGGDNKIAAVLLVLTGFVTGAAVIAYLIAARVVRALTALDFGFCPGRTQGRNSDQAISDWLADKIEAAAGRMSGKQRPAAPLTFGDLWEGPDRKGSETDRAIDLRMMTTNLSLRRPNTLPQMDGNHFFSEAEFRRLFPDWIVEYLVVAARAAEEEARLKDEQERRRHEAPPPGYLKFPSGARLPLVVAARMSLSFPILFATVPLHRKDFAHRVGDAEPPVQRMLFSDGGLSSNFPVHFFDALLPSRPTFGISLESYDERDRPEPQVTADKQDEEDEGRRVALPMDARRGMWLDSEEIGTLSKFLVTLVNAAKDWQDRLQSTLPGYRERITSVYLKSDEGGLNLTMPPKLIDRLVEFGGRAGALMTGTSLSPADKDPFDFSDHRWRRYLVAFARLEETLTVAARSWGDPAHPDSFAAFIRGYMNDPGSYHRSQPAWRAEVFERFDALMKMAAGWRGKELRDRPDGQIPRPEPIMRITPRS